MKGEEMDQITNEDEDAPVISSSATALQQAELKKEMLHSLISSRSHSEIK